MKAVVVNYGEGKKVCEFLEMSLDGHKMLTITLSRGVFDISKGYNHFINKPISSETIDEKKYKLIEVTKEELKKLRKGPKAGFVLKEGEKLYYTPIPKGINYVTHNVLGCHLCGGNGNACKRLLATCDENGGCAKVRAKSQGIENFPFISLGYETFGAKVDAFVVAYCQHFKVEMESDRKHPSDVAEAKFGLAQYVFPEIETYSQYYRKMEAVRGRRSYERIGWL